MTALRIRKDRSAVSLRKLAKTEADARVSRRILAIANALSGMSRKEAAEAAGMDRQTLRDWVARYNAHGLDGLADRWGEGRPPVLSVQEQADLVTIVMSGSDPEASGLSAYTLEDLAVICAERFGKRLHPWSVGRLLHRLGLSRQKTRPSHPMKDPAEAEAFKKSPASPAKNSAYA
jgi:transposase